MFPYIGIGRRLVERGHEVFLFASEPFRAATEAAGVAFVSIWSREEYEAVMHHPDLWNPIRSLRLILRLLTDRFAETKARLLEHLRPGETVLVGHTLGMVSRVLEESRGIPAATIHLAPSVFRSEHAQPVYGPMHDFSGWPRWTKRSFWWAVDRFLIDPAIAPTLNALAAAESLPPIRRVFQDFIHSPRLVIGLFPDWFGPPQPDWPAALRLTGFPLHDDDRGGALEPTLAEFLDAGAPPIAFTPGTANVQAASFFRAAVEACGKIGRRALLLTAHREQVPDRLAADALHVPFAPFSRLLPRCAALAHHGGIGTSAAALAAGIPQLVMPLAFDQPDNAARLRRLKVGRWILPGKFRADRVAAALTDLLESSETAEACRELKERIASQDALAETCDLLEKISCRPGNPDFAGSPSH